MTQEKATAQRCGHNHSTNFNWETKAAYDDGQMLCWDCNQMFTPEPLPQTYGSLANQRDALLSEVAELKSLLKPIVDCYGLGLTAEKFTDQVGPFILGARALLGKER